MTLKKYGSSFYKSSFSKAKPWLLQQREFGAGKGKKGTTKKTPAEEFNHPPIGVITTKEQTLRGVDQTPDFHLKAEKYDVIGVSEDMHGIKTYVTNTWYDKDKRIPLLIHEAMVDNFQDMQEAMIESDLDVQHRAWKAKDELIKVGKNNDYKLDSSTVSRITDKFDIELEDLQRAMQRSDYSLEYNGYGNFTLEEN